MDIDDMHRLFERHFKTFGVYPESFAELVDKYRNVHHPDDPCGTKYRCSLERPPICNKETPYYLWTLGSNSEVGGDGAAKDIANRIL